MMRNNRIHRLAGCGLAVSLAATIACRSNSIPKPATTAPATQAPTPGIALLITQAHFVKTAKPDGTTEYKPAPARLILAYPGPDGAWTRETIEDEDANVYHKAMPFDLPGHPTGILTISGIEAPAPAKLKVWHRTVDGWKSETLFEAAFGGKTNRFRDIEIGDVTGDDRPDLVIATHDQGVVYVLQNQGNGWMPLQIDHAPNTFVHEIELGDVDGDGRIEIFATPSEPNREHGQQAGHVVTYRYDGKTFTRHVVEEFADRHVKEILVADIEGRKKPALFAVAETGLPDPNKKPDPDQFVHIKRYVFADGAFHGRLIATIPDTQCRFLNAGDVDGDGKKELIASAYKAGVWMFKPAGDDEEWPGHVIDRNSSGYEHATVLADLDKDGTLEIYVAADDQGALRRYVWNGTGFDRTNLLDLSRSDITWCVMPCTNPDCLSVHW
jgi:hypothetical protein